MPEKIEADGEILAYVIRSDEHPSSTRFVTAPELPMQLGFVVYPAGGEAAAHRHAPVDRRTPQTPEALLVRKGRCLVDLYDRMQEHVRTVELGVGDLVLLLDCGHGVRMVEETVLLELKPGPYAGGGEKEYFG